MGNVGLTENEQNDAKNHNAECGPDIALAQDDAKQLGKGPSERHEA